MDGSAILSALATTANGTIDANATLDVASSGTLDLNGNALSNNGTLILGGMIANATLSGTNPIYQGGTLDNVTNGGVDLSADGAAANVTGGLTVGDSFINGTSYLTGAGSTLTVLDDETFYYNQIMIGSTTGGASALIADHTLSFDGTSAIIQQVSNTVSEIGGTGTITVSGIEVNGTHDTMLIDVANFDINSSMYFNDRTSGGSATISSGNFTNAGVVRVGDAILQNAASSTLILAAATTTNNGVIYVDDGNIVLATTSAGVSGTGSLEFNSEGYAETNTLVATVTQTFGNAIVLNGSNGTNTIAASNGAVLTLAGDISSSSSGPNELTIGDSQHAGTVVFGQANANYTEPLTIAAGTLELSAANQSSGGITFASGSDATLKIDGSTGPANETITGFTLGDTIDLTSIGLATAATLDSTTDMLTISGGSSPISLQLAGDYSDFTFGVVSDGALGTDVVAVGPHITTLSAAAGGMTNLSAGQAVTFTLASNVAITTIDTTNGLPTLSLSNGEVATFDAAHSTPTSLVFDYTVAATGDDTPDLTVTGLNTHGATLTDAAGNELTGFGVAALSGSDTHLVINTAPPVIVTPPPVTVTTPPADTRFDLADLTASTSGSFFGGDYIGPVSYLQAEYLSTGSDNVVLDARVANVFLHSGAGTDALAVMAGSNVLDGGGGSNWLVGADGTDGGKDTFFADGRTDQHIWDTLVNFHPGDMLTLLGFDTALGSMSWSDNMGSANYQGATLHVSFGNSSGSDALVTFAGLSSQAAKFATSTDTVGGVTYLAVTRLS